MKTQQNRKPPEAPKPSLVSPVVAGLFSAILPGLGHAFARNIRKGLLLLFSLVSIAGLWLWRINLTGRREIGFIAKMQKSFELQPVLLVLAIAIVIIYLWIIIDAYLTAKKVSSKSNLILWVLVLASFFALGWQIGDIRIPVLVQEAKKATPILMRVLWPWERAVTRPEELLVGFAEVQVPCVDPVPEQAEIDADEPYIVVNPTCGTLSQQDGASGTILQVSGGNFEPDTETEIWWQDDQGNEFRQRQEGEYIKVVTDAEGGFELELVMPYRVIPPSATRDYAIWQLQGRQVAAVGDPVPSQELILSIEKMVETIMLGMMSTFFGIILSIPVSFLAARNLMSANWFTVMIYYLVRGVLNIIRSIEPLVWAVIAIITVGLGPFAGIIALTIHSVAALGKLYSEAIESIDPGPVEAIQATGANWLQTVFYAVVPQIIPPFVSFTIYRWDINVRMSTIIGMVGGGGIGFLLIQWIRLLDYRAAGIAIWFIAITVAILDYVSAEIRNRFA